MRLDPRVLEFLKESATPEEHLEDYLNDATFRALLPAIKRYVPRCSDSLRKQWAAAFLALIDVPLTLRGARRAWRVLRYLVPYYLQRTTPPILPLPYRVLSALLRGIDAYPKLRLMTAKVPQEQAQLFTLHLKAFSRNERVFSRKKRAQQPSAVYALWIPTFHEGLREIQRTTPKSNTVKGYMTSVRMFFRHCPPNTLTQPIFTPSPMLLDRHLEESFNAYQSALKKDRNASQTAEVHKKNIRRLFANHQIHQRNTRQGIETRQVPHGESIRERVPFEELPIHLHERVHQAERSAISEVEYLVDLEYEEEADECNDPNIRVSERVYITRSSDRVVPRPPNRQRHRLNPYLLAAFPWWWDCRASVNLTDLQMLYHYIYALMEWQGNRYAGPALFALFALFTGRTLRDLARLQFATYPDKPNSEELSRDGFFFDADRYWFFYFQDRGRASFAGDPSQGWLSSTPWVAFPSPNILRPLLIPYLNRLRQCGAITPDSYVLYDETRKGYLKQLAPNRFDSMVKRDYHASTSAGYPLPLPLWGESKAFLTELPANRLIRPPRRGTFLKPVPLTHIAKAFPALIGHGGGLDNVAVRLISGRGALRSYAQLHYTRLTPSAMFSNYQEACATLHQKIIEDLAHHARLWWLNEVVTPSTTIPVQATTVPVQGFGSPLVRQDDAIRRSVERLRHIIIRTRTVRSLADVITHHNAYTCYAYLLLLHMGIRPQRNPTVSSESEATSWDWLIITDKRSATYLEQRLLLLPAPGPVILMQLSQERDRLRRALWAHAGTTPVKELDAARINQSRPLFQFLDFNGQCITFSLAAFREQLCRFRIDLPRTTQTNWGRHWIRTHLYADGFAEDLIDLWLGHVRAGREPLAHHSSTCYGSALQQVSERVRHHLAVIEFRQVQYFPGG